MKRFGKVLLGLSLAGSIFAGDANAQPRVLQAIASATSPPFSVVRDNGALEGLMIDLCEAIAADNGWTFEYETMPFAELLPTMAAGGADMICSVFSYTAARAEVVAYTPSYYTAGEGMAVLATDATAYANWLEVQNERVGATAGTVYEAAMQAAGFTNVVPFPSDIEALAALAAGDIKAFFVLDPVLRYWVNELHPNDLRVVDTYVPTRVGTFHIAVRKDDPELLAAVNASLAKLSGTGVVRQILADWGLH
ncbi:MAG: amino acid ABC transporter substrate-binding protein [Bauldia sp.]|nr:amino acid ABC transporter substrate-binding protein [Bauldia sp.]